MSVIKVCKKVFCTVLLLFGVIWGASLIRCEVLTYRYGEPFSTLYQENSMLGGIASFKVLDYSDSAARVYYVSENRSAGDVLTFSNENGVWTYDSWERTVWSRQGSADGCVWPYILDEIIAISPITDAHRAD